MGRKCELEPPDEKTRAQLHKLCDVDGNEVIDPKEAKVAFQAWVAMRTLINDSIFKIIDQDGTGNIHKSELKPALMELNDGVEVSDEQIDDIFIFADANGDGDLQYEELRLAIAAWFCAAEESKQDILFRKVLKKDPRLKEIGSEKKAEEKKSEEKKAEDKKSAFCTLL